MQKLLKPGENPAYLFRLSKIGHSVGDRILILRTKQGRQLFLVELSLENAVDEIGLFGNQNTICKPTTPKWRHTIDRLKQHFPGSDK